MKRQLMIVVALVAVIVGGGTGAVLAGHGPGGGGRPPSFNMGEGGFDSRMVKILKLTASQQTLIKAIFESHRKEVALLFDKMHESKRALMQAADATVFDETCVRAAAVAQANIETELTVSRTRIQIQINALLTPEQREMWKLLRSDTDRMAMPPRGGE